MSKIDFENIAIKCDTWEQMQHVAEVAAQQGCRNVEIEECDFLDGNIYFEINSHGDGYRNYRIKSVENRVVKYQELFPETPVINPVAWYDDVHVMD